jgi:hypothetical protein
MQMNYRKLYFIIVLCLGIGTLFSLAINYFWISLDGFFINLSTELLGLLIGFIFVDFLIRRYEQNQWQEVSDLVTDQVANILRISSMYLERLFSVSAADSFKYYTDHPERIRDDLDDPRYSLYMLSNVVTPRLEENLKYFGHGNWKEVGVITVTALEQIEKIFGMFGSKLNSQVFGRLIEVQRSGYRLAAFADIIYKSHGNPSVYDSIVPVKRFVVALIELGQVLNLS